MAQLGDRVTQYLSAQGIVSPAVLEKIHTMGVDSVDVLKRATFEDFLSVDSGRGNIGFAVYVYFKIHPPVELDAPTKQFLTAANVASEYWRYMQRLEGLLLEHIGLVTVDELTGVGMSAFPAKVIVEKIKKQ